MLPAAEVAAEVAVDVVVPEVVQRLAAELPVVELVELAEVVDAEPAELLQPVVERRPQLAAVRADAAEPVAEVELLRLPAGSLVMGSI